MTRYLLKVTAFVTRTGPGGVELLFFQHPNAGVQLPAGTVEEGETVEQAVLREVFEETGLTQVRLVQQIGLRDELPPDATHVILHKTRVYSRPDAASFDWAEFRRGKPVRKLREAGGFVQVTYEEGDRYPDPTYLSYVITGWVPEDSLAETNRRHFFHLALTGPAPERWQQPADNHIFQPFWAPLSAIPQDFVQRPWLDFVTLDLGYSFG